MNIKMISAAAVVLVASGVAGWLYYTLSMPRMTGIDRVIIGVDANPMYIQFWPLAARAWKEVAGIQPTLALIADDSVTVDESLGDVIRFKPIPGVPTWQYAQTIRNLLPAYFPDDVCLLSDMDMIPMSRSYFHDGVKGEREDAFVVYRSKAYEGEFDQYPMCYNAAKGKTFAEVFHIKRLSDIPKIIRSWSALKLGWMTDEILLKKYLHAWKHFDKRCILKHLKLKRLDRIAWQYDPQDILRNRYVDCHLLRPYDKYQRYIDPMAELLFQSDDCTAHAAPQS